MSATIECGSKARYIYATFCGSGSYYRAKLENYEPIAKMRR